MSKPLKVQLIALCALLAFTKQASADNPEPTVEPLRLSPPVVCFKIDGHGDYEPRPEPVLTKVEKLLIYVEPLNHTIEREKSNGKYYAHFSQSARIRRKGEQRVLWEKKELGEYKPESDWPPRTIYLSSMIALQGLSPGDYEIDITYRDLLKDGAETTETIEFRIKPLPTTSTDPS